MHYQDWKNLLENKDAEPRKVVSKFSEEINEMLGKSGPSNTT